MTQPDVLVAGETLVDFHPDGSSARGRGGRLAEVERFIRRPGGAPANVAVGLARLGPPPWFWTRVGADPFGDFLADTLAEHGLSDRFVERDAAAMTTLAFVGPRESSGPRFTFYRDGTADTRLALGSIPDDCLESVEWCYVGGVGLAAEPTRSALFDLVERARGAGCTVAFDPNVRPEVWADDATAVIDRMLGLAHVVAATSADLAAAGVAAPDARSLATTVCQRGPHTALVTLGADGAVGHATDAAPWGSATVTHGGYDVDALDPTGAGDAFAAGVIRSLADGAALPEAVRFANAVAALSTTARGAMAALPNRTAVEALQRG